MSTVFPDPEPAKIAVCFLSDSSSTLTGESLSIALPSAMYGTRLVAKLVVVTVEGGCTASVAWTGRPPGETCAGSTTASGRMPGVV